MKIGELARRAGVPASAIRFYEAVGVLPRASRQSGQRRFSPDVELYLAIIDFARKAGFTITDVKLLFHGFRTGTSPSVRWRKLARRKLAEIEQQIVRLKGMERLLKKSTRCHCLRLEDCGRELLLRSGKKNS